MSTGALTSIRSGGERTAQWAVVALGFSIPISVALDNVLLAVILAGWLAAGNFRETWQFVARSRTALAALILYGLLLAGTLYGERESGDIGRTLTKYVDLLFIPLFAVLLRDAARRRLALLGFAAALVLVLVLSYLVAIGVPFPRWVVVGDTTNPAVFKHYLTHGILLAYGTFLFVEMALAAATPRERAGWLAAALFAALNVMIMMQSRTGHVILVVLALYLGYRLRRWTGLAIATAAVAAIIVLLAQLPGVFQERYGLVKGDWASSRASVWAKESNQQRRDYYLASLAIIKDHPLAGVGTCRHRGVRARLRRSDPRQERVPNAQPAQRVPAHRRPTRHDRVRRAALAVLAALARVVPPRLAAGMPPLARPAPRHRGGLPVQLLAARPHRRAALRLAHGNTFRRATIRK
jgi:O-antigen ligase